MIVFAFDRDHTLDVNPHHRKEPMVPLSWVRYLAHETNHEVWATGNQALCEEADVPGTSEALSRVDYEPVGVGLDRRQRVTLLGQLFPEADRYVVVDDVDLSHPDGWEHYFPWTFVERVRAGHLEIGVSDALLAE